MKSSVLSALDEYIDMHENRASQINFDGMSSTDFEFLGSKLFIKHIIFNLLDNAFKYGGSDVSVNIYLKDNTLRVKDNGVGIEKRMLKKIFNKFYTSSATGTGIGLSFCAKAMENMGGNIECESEKGNYTMFIMKFPTDPLQ